MEGIPAAAVEAMLWRSARPAGKKLRVGIIVEHWTVPHWIFSAISILSSTPEIQIGALFWLEGPMPRVPSPSPIFEFLHTRSRAVEDVEFPWTDIAGCFPGIPRVIIQTDERGSPTPVSRSAVTSASLDFIVRFDRDRLSGPSAGLASLGVWSLQLGAALPGSPEPPYWPEVRNKIPVSSISLREHRDRLESGRIFYSYSAPTLQGWFFTRNATEPLNMAGVIVADRLLAATALSDVPSTAPDGPDGDDATSAFPDAVETLKFALRQSRRSIGGRLRARRRKASWFIALRGGSDRFVRSTSTFLPDGYREIETPDGSGWADPFLIERKGRDFLFFEQIPPDSHLGRLAMAEILADGSLGPPAVVLEKPYHLSYPFVLRQGDDLFLIPESATDRTVQLYRAHGDSALDWHFEKNLCEGAMLVDTTPFFHDGLWYFFTTQVDYGMRTLLFFSPSLDGEWIYHPANPICSDASRARSAGALFYREGKLIRPAQDCSVRYGYAIVLNEVLKLSPSEYAERVNETIMPSWCTGLLGTHTLNSSKRWEAIDGLRFTG